MHLLALSEYVVSLFFILLRKASLLNLFDISYFLRD